MDNSAEQYVIGALLLDLSCIHKFYDNLRPEMFLSELYGRMYVEILRAYDNNQKIDVAILVNKIQCESYPASIAMQELKKCVAQSVTSINAKYYAEMVIDAYKARQLSAAINNIHPSPEDINSQISSLIGTLEALKSGEKAGAKTLKQIAEENRSTYFCESVTEKIYTGFQQLDELLGGLEGGDMIVIGARPAVGKSAFVTQITSNLARQHKKIGFYNLEMKNRQIYERFIVANSGIGLKRLKRAKCFLGDEKERFERANTMISSDNIIINDASKSVSQIRNECKHMDYDVIIIDYLQLLKSDVKYSNRTSEVGAISKAIKAIAMDLNIPVIVLSQLNRVSELRETKEPTMAELREAGDIEQDASVIILMWNLTEDRKVKGLKVDKNRQGENGKVVLKFKGDLMQFVESKETVKQVEEWSKPEEKTPFD